MPTSARKVGFWGHFRFNKAFPPVGFGAMWASPPTGRWCRLLTKWHWARNDIRFFWRPQNLISGIIFDILPVFCIISLVRSHRPRRFGRRCTVKDGCLRPARAEWRRVFSLAGNYPKEAIHITSTILAVLGALGSIASIVSLVLYLYDKKK